MQDKYETDIKKLEQQLADLSPSPLSENLISRMEQAMESWEIHLPLEEKIVPFESHKQIQDKKKSSFPVWSAAAAIALMGAVGAIFMTSPDDSTSLSTQLATTATDENPNLNPEPTTIAPHFSHQLSNASNEGITYAGNDKPYKVIRIEYTKDVEYTDDKGNTYIKKEPAVDHILVPVDIH